MTTPATVLKTIALEPRQVLDVHTALYARLQFPPQHVTDFYQQFFTEESINRLQPGTQLLEQWLQMFAPVRSGAEFLQMVRAPLYGAPNYQVGENIVRAVTGLYQETASKVLHVSPADLPSESGFAWLNYPVLLCDASGKRLATRALSWGPDSLPPEFLNGMWPPPESGTRHDGIRISSWAHADDIDDFTDLRARQALLANGMPLSISHSAFIPFDTRLRARDLKMIDDDDIIRWTHVLWMFMTTEIVTSARPFIERHARRRAERSIVTNTVNVVTLRRSASPKDAEHEPRKVDWSCCWIVQAHWRHLDSYEPEFAHHLAKVNRNEGGPAKHCTVCQGRVTNVHAYVKGPDGLPLKSVPETLYRVAR